MAMRFIRIASSLLLGNDSRAESELAEFLSLYKSLLGDLWMDWGWSFAGIENYIQNFNEIDKIKKDLLIEIIKILKSTKPASREELKRLEDLT